MSPPAAPMNVEGISGGGAAVASKGEGAHTGDESGGQRVAKPIGNIGGPGANTEQVPSPPTSSPAMERVWRTPSPPASSSAMGVGTGAKQEPIAPEPPVEMALGVPCHHQERAAR